MLKLIDQLSSGKDFLEEEETSPETSGESNSNSQEGFIKSVCEEKLLPEDPSEVKKFKSDEETAVKPDAPIISEAIESPVLMVKGEGNGADCDAGNPGEDKPESNCQDKTKGDKITGAADKSGDNTDTISSSKVTDNAPSMLQNSSPVRDKWKETPPLIDKTEQSNSSATNSDASVAPQIEVKNSAKELEAQKNPLAGEDSLQVGGHNNQVTSCNNLAVKQTSVGDIQSAIPVDTTRTDLPVDDQATSSIAVKESQDISTTKQTSISKPLSSGGDGNDLNAPPKLAQTLNLVNYGDSESSSSNEEERNVDELEDLKDVPAMKEMNSEEAKTEKPAKETKEVKNELATVGTSVNEDEERELKTENLKVDSGGATKDVANKEEAVVNQETTKHASTEKHEGLRVQEKAVEATKEQENTERVPEKMPEVAEKSQTAVEAAGDVGKVEGVKENDATLKEKSEPVESFSFIPLSKDNRLTKTTLSFGKPQSEQRDTGADAVAANDLLTNPKCENDNSGSPRNALNVKGSIADKSQCSKDLKDSRSNPDTVLEKTQLSHQSGETSSLLLKVDPVTEIDSTSNPSIHVATSIKSNEVEKLEVKGSTTEPIGKPGTVEFSKRELEDPLTESTTPVKPTEVEKPSMQLEVKEHSVQPVGESEATKSSKVKESAVEPRSEPGTNESSKRIQSPTSSKTNKAEKPATKPEAETSFKSNETGNSSQLEVKESAVEPRSEPGTNESSKLELMDQSTESTAAVESNAVGKSSTQLEVKESATELIRQPGTGESSKSETKDRPIKSAAPDKSNAIEKPSTRLEVNACAVEHVDEPGTVAPSKLERKDRSTESAKSVKPNEMESSTAQLEVKESTMKPVSKPGITESIKPEPMDQSVEPTPSFKSSKLEKPSVPLKAKEMAAEPATEPGTTKSSKPDPVANEQKSTGKLSEKPSVPEKEKESDPREALHDNILVKSETNNETDTETTSFSPDKEEDSAKHSSQSSSDSGKSNSPKADLKVAVEEEEEEEEDASVPVAKKSKAEPLKDTKGISFAI